MGNTRSISTTGGGPLGPPLVEELELLDEALLLDEELLLEELELDDELELELELLPVPPPSQTEPVTVGVAALDEPLSTCSPNSADCPGWMLPFHDKLLAVYGLLPDTLAFQLLVTTVPSPYSQLTSQPSMALEPSLVMRIPACAPEPQSLTTMYSQVAAVAACIEPQTHKNRNNDEIFKAGFFIIVSCTIKM